MYTNNVQKTLIIVTIVALAASVMLSALFFESWLKINDDWTLAHAGATWWIPLPSISCSRRNSHNQYLLHITVMQHRIANDEEKLFDHI